MSEMDEIKQQCIFCQIVAGNVPTKKVYEDDYCSAIIDINPAAPGHLLVLTKEHYAIMPQVPEFVIGHLGQVAKGLSRAMIKSLKVEGTSIFIANGIAGGQRAQHFMLHVIPRRDNDNIPLLIPENAIAEGDEEKLRGLLTPAIKNVLDFDVEVLSEEKEEPAEKETKKELKEKNEEKEKKEDAKEESEDKSEEKEEPITKSASRSPRRSSSLDTISTFLTK